MNLRFLSLLFLVLVPSVFAEEGLPGSPLLEPAATPEERSVA
ncbi:MAG: hypothetical protein JWO45_713, partial [Spartobacteria bacterium]|nr:hypothetical protein [Spartobacteria bacterium]